MSISLRTLESSAACCALAASSFAQSFNLDVGANQSAPLPANSYGAAANQNWILVRSRFDGGSPVTLKDLTTNLITSVTITPTGRVRRLLRQHADVAG